MGKKRTFPAKLILLLCIASLALGACGGAGSEKTWFNLPSIALKVGGDGDSVNILGLPVTTLSSIGLKDFVGTLDAGGIKSVEVRLGHNGVHVYVDDSELPYVYWDDESVSELATVLAGMDVNVDSALINVVRTFGVGVRLAISSQRPDFRWNGETSFNPSEAPAEMVGPLHLQGLAVDSSGAASLDGVSLSALGVPPLLDEHTLNLLAGMGAETLRISTTPNTLDIAMNGNALPGLAYDEESLAAGLEFARILLAEDPASLALVESYLPRLPALDLIVEISLTGTPVGSTVLGPLHVDVADDGTVSVLGLPLPPDVLPMDALAPLTDAGINRLDVQVSSDGVALAGNGTVLPSISWEAAGLDLIDGLMGGSGTVPGALGIVEALSADGPLSLLVTLPGSGGEAGTSPLEGHSFAAQDLGDANPPTLRLQVDVDNGMISSVSGLNLDDLGASDVALPANVLDILASNGVSSLLLDSSANNLTVHMNGASALSLGYDVAALEAVLALLPGLMGDGLADQAMLLDFVTAHMLPMIVAADADIAVSLN